MNTPCRSHRILKGTLLGLISLLGLVACGGGGSSSSGGDVPVAAAAVSTVTVTGFTPTSAAPGDTLTVSGSGFAKVAAVQVGGVAAAFTASSDSRLTVAVPVGVSSTVVTLNLYGAGFSVQPLQTLAVDIPALTSVSATSVAPGATIFVTGSKLDTVQSFSVNGVALLATDVTSTSAVLQAPMVIISGAITLVDAVGVARQTGQQLSTSGPVLISSMSRAAAVAGDSVTVYGAGLADVSSVSFDNGLLVAITAQSASALTFTVPALAGATAAATGGPASGTYATALTFATATERATTAITLKVGPALSIDKTAAITDHHITTVTVTGGHLSLVTGATVGSAVATIDSAADNKVTLTVPGETGGAVTLSSAYQTGVTAGAVSSSSLGVVSLSELDFVQVINRSGTDASLRLTPNRPVLVRAFVSTSLSEIANPGVTLVVTNGSATLGSLTMTGPATLPVATDVNKLSTTYNVTVPAAWVAPGVSFKAVLAPSAELGLSTSVSSAPAVGKPTKLKLVLVPLVVNGVAGQLPSLSLAHDVFARVYPMASSDIVVTTRAPFAVSGVTTIATDADENLMLGQLEALRQQENSDAVYLGLFPASQANSSLGGIGYVNVAGLESQAGMSSISFDAAYTGGGPDSLNLDLPAWAQVALHEVGHNHSLRHAPCGSPTMLDTGYPYAGGVLNPNMPVYDSFYSDDTSIGMLGSTTPAAGAMTDLMGYCSGVYFSDYHYNKVQAFAEARAAIVQPKAQALAVSVKPSAGYIVFSGTLGPQGVRLNAAQATTRESPDLPQAATPYALRITTAAGQVLSYPLLASEVADGQEPLYHFATSVPNPGEVSKVDVLKGGIALPAAGLTTKAQSAGAQNEGSSRSASWAETNGVLQLAWNAPAEPFASVVYVGADGKRSVIAMRLQGGTASISTLGLPAGGRFEISFSSTANARFVTLAR